MVCVYILKDGSIGKYYVGSTNDLDRRIKEHKRKNVHSTRKFSQINLVFWQKYDNDFEGRMIEKRLKKFKRKDFLEKIIKDGFIKTKLSDASINPDASVKVTPTLRSG